MATLLVPIHEWMDAPMQIVSVEACLCPEPRLPACPDFASQLLLAPPSACVRFSARLRRLTWPTTWALPRCTRPQGEDTRCAQSPGPLRLSLLIFLKSATATRAEGSCLRISNFPSAPHRCVAPPIT